MSPAPFFLRFKTVFGEGTYFDYRGSGLDRYAQRTERPHLRVARQRLRHYPETTFLLKTRAHFRSDDQRPTIELEPTEHPLSVEQGSGISVSRAWEIVHGYAPD